MLCRHRSRERVAYGDIGDLAGLTARSNDYDASMPKRIELATDIAIVGVWDPGENHAHKPRDFQAFIESQAKLGRLFFINTAADGGFPCNIYIDQPPAPDDLALYTRYEPAHLIQSKSGRLLAGGVEDFGNPNPQITSQADAFAVTPGHYALHFYELDDDRYLTHLTQHIGEEEMDYYSRRLGGCGVGCLCLVLAVLSAAGSWVLTDVTPWLWLIPAVFIAIGVTYLTLRSRALGKDERFQEIAERSAAFSELYPAFIFVLRPIAPEDEIQGGWHDLI